MLARSEHARDRAEPRFGNLRVQLRPSQDAPLEKPKKPKALQRPKREALEWKQQPLRAVAGDGPGHPLAA